MNGKIMVALSVIFNIIFIINLAAQAQVDKIVDFERKVQVNGNPATKGMPVHIGDEIRTGTKSRVKVEIELPNNEKVEFNLKANSQVKIKALYELAGLDGQIIVNTKGKGVKYTVNTARENIGSSGTHFSIITREGGTIVDVLYHL